MNKEEFTSIEPEPSRSKLGDRVRAVADRLKQETDLQIKATARILGAAAQISENHERLIAEVANMVEEDLSQQSEREIYTVEKIKKQFKTLREAKAYFGLKANSWIDLVKKINNFPPQTPTFTGPIDSHLIDRVDKIENEISQLRAEVNQILAILEQFKGVL